MTPAEAAIWAAAYGAAFAAEVRELEQASDENDPIERTLDACARVSAARCVRIADAAVDSAPPSHPALVSRDNDEPAPHSSPV